MKSEPVLLQPKGRRILEPRSKWHWRYLMRWILAAVILLSGSGVWVQAAAQEAGAAAKKQEASKPQQTLPIYRIRVGADVQKSKLVQTAAPVYPPLARQARIEGKVKLHIIVGTDGAVKEEQVISGHPLLVQSALDAVKKWKYRPTTIEGKPTEVDTTVEIIFKLRG
jgi:TonB family protein